MGGGDAVRGLRGLGGLGGKVMMRCGVVRAPGVGGAGAVQG